MIDHAAEFPVVRIGPRTPRVLEADLESLIEQHRDTRGPR